MVTHLCISYKLLNYTISYKCFCSFSNQMLFSFLFYIFSIYLVCYLRHLLHLMIQMILTHFQLFILLFYQIHLSFLILSFFTIFQYLYCVLIAYFIFRKYLNIPILNLFIDSLLKIHFVILAKQLLTFVYIVIFAFYNVR